MFCGETLHQDWVLRNKSEPDKEGVEMFTGEVKGEREGGSHGGQ